MRHRCFRELLAVACVLLGAGCTAEPSAVSTSGDTIAEVDESMSVPSLEVRRAWRDPDYADTVLGRYVSLVEPETGEQHLSLVRALVCLGRVEEANAHIESEVARFSTDPVADSPELPHGWETEPRTLRDLAFLRTLKASETSVALFSSRYERVCRELGLVGSNAESVRDELMRVDRDRVETVATAQLEERFAGSVDVTNPSWDAWVFSIFLVRELLPYGEAMSLALSRVADSEVAMGRDELQGAGEELRSTRIPGTVVVWNCRTDASPLRTIDLGAHAKPTHAELDALQAGFDLLVRGHRPASSSLRAGGPLGDAAGMERLGEQLREPLLAGLARAVSPGVEMWSANARDNEPARDSEVEPAGDPDVEPAGDLEVESASDLEVESAGDFDVEPARDLDNGRVAVPSFQDQRWADERIEAFTHVVESAREAGADVVLIDGFLLPPSDAGEPTLQVFERLREGFLARIVESAEIAFVCATPPRALGMAELAVPSGLEAANLVSIAAVDDLARPLVIASAPADLVIRGARLPVPILGRTVHVTGAPFAAVLTAVSLLREDSPSGEGKVTALRRREFGTGTGAWTASLGLD